MKKLSPQAELVLKHLKNVGPITPVEAAAVHRIRHLPRRIADLKEAGHTIVTDIRYDATGQRYAKYRLIQAAGFVANVVIVDDLTVGA